MASLFLAYPVFTESPRWLLSQKGRILETEQLLNKIAKQNNRPEPRDLYNRLKVINEIILNEPKYGIISLFSRFGMAIKTILLIMCMVANEWIHRQLLININNMEGSYFLNLVVLSLIEIPGFFFASWMAVSLVKKSFFYRKTKLSVKLCLLQHICVWLIYILFVRTNLEEDGVKVDYSLCNHSF